MLPAGLNLRLLEKITGIQEVLAAQDCRGLRSGVVTNQQTNQFLAWLEHVPGMVWPYRYDDGSDGRLIPQAGGDLSSFTSYLG